MKKCPFCAEEIQDEALKCKHCGEFLDKKPAEKWYFKTTTLVTLFVVVGPLALPLVWFHPRMSSLMKAVVTAVTLAATYALAVAMGEAMHNLTDAMKQLSGAGL